MQDKSDNNFKKTFSSLSGNYDIDALRFFRDSAGYFSSILNLEGHEHVLDVAAGTGHLTLAAAEHLKSGSVTAIDFSASMLEQAKKKAEIKGIVNAEFIEMDMQNLTFPDNHFDAALCAFGIFFAEDLERQLKHIAQKVKKGGLVAVSTFREDYFQPLRGMFTERFIDYGIKPGPEAWKRTASETGCKELFETCGLCGIRTETKNVGYFLRDENEWWDIIWNAGFRRFVNQLEPGERDRFREEHMNEVSALKSDKGIWLDIEVIYTFGVK